jgi:hypothetical protein
MPTPEALALRVEAERQVAAAVLALSLPIDVAAAVLSSRHAR